MTEQEIAKIEELGFIKVPHDLDWDDDLLGFEGGYSYNLGHSRRGQFYYYIVMNRKLYIIATKPDGDGAEIEANPKIIKDLVDSGLVDITD
jgi:hypothetical protein